MSSRPTSGPNRGSTPSGYQSQIIASAAIAPGNSHAHSKTICRSEPAVAPRSGGDDGDDEHRRVTRSPGDDRQVQHQSVGPCDPKDCAEHNRGPAGAPIRHRICRRG